MNIKIFSEGEVEKDWSGITDSISDIEHVYEEMLFEMKEYADQSADDIIVLHARTVFQALVILKAVLSKKQAEGEVIRDLQKLALEN